MCYVASNVLIESRRGDGGWGDAPPSNGSCPAMLLFPYPSCEDVYYRRLSRDYEYFAEYSHDNETCTTRPQGVVPGCLRRAQQLAVYSRKSRCGAVIPLRRTRSGVVGESGLGLCLPVGVV